MAKVKVKVIAKKEDLAVEPSSTKTTALALIPPREKGTFSNIADRKSILPKTKFQRRKEAINFVPVKGIPFSEQLKARTNKKPARSMTIFVSEAEYRSAEANALAAAEYLETIAIDTRNIDKAKITTARSIIGPVAINPRRKHIFKHEKNLRDPVIAHTPEGKRIFAYNANGHPVCYSRKRDNPDDRCQSVFTFFNGRCMYHGGKSVKGEDHFRTSSLRNSDTLPTYLQANMMRAALDPDLLSLDHEIKLTDAEMKMYETDLNIGISTSAMRKLQMLITLLDKNLDNDLEVTEELLKEIVNTFQKNKDTQSTFSKMNSLKLVRAKLVEAQHKRERDLGHLMRQEQAMALVMSLSSGAKQQIASTFRDIEERYILIDSLKLPYNVKVALEEIAGTYLSKYIDKKIETKFKNGVNELVKQSTATSPASRAKGEDDSVLEAEILGEK